jgi:FkbM family methyltransferase
MFNRLMIWLNILKNVRGISLRTQLGLIISMPTDMLFHVIGASLAVLPKVYVSGVIYLKTYDVYFYVRAFSDDLYSVMPRREGDVNDLILSILTEGDVFIDIGANIGYYSVLTGKIIGDSGLVIAVEPVPTTARVLRDNIRLNNLKNVRSIQKAAWSDNRIVNIHVPKGFFGLASIVNLHPSELTITVEGIPLDAFCEAQEVKLLKIDAEGSEYQILKGARKTLKKTKYVILEASTRKDEIIHLLREEGFKIHKLKFTTYIVAYK